MPAFCCSGVASTISVERRQLRLVQNEELLHRGLLSVEQYSAYGLGAISRKSTIPCFTHVFPATSRVSTVKTYGGVAAKVKGQMFAGLFARGAIVRLLLRASEDGARHRRRRAVRHPMGNGCVTAKLVERICAGSPNRSSVAGFARPSTTRPRCPPRKEKRKAAAGPVLQGGRKGGRQGGSKDGREETGASSQETSRPLTAGRGFICPGYCV